MSHYLLPKEETGRVPKIKICGITNLEDALLAIELGADELGFNFYKKSPRYISPEDARSIALDLPEDTVKIGVFVNATAEEISDAAYLAKLTAVQFHGEEDRDFVEMARIKLGLTVIKAFRVSPEFRVEDTENYLANAFLLDGFSTKERGGTGDTFDWTIAEAIAGRVKKLYLAGGLTPENVGEAIRRVRPYAVDVCSRIESEPGKKDAEKLKRFVAAVQETI